MKSRVELGREKQSINMRLALGLILAAGCSATATSSTEDAGVMQTDVVTAQDEAVPADAVDAADVVHTCGFVAESITGDNARTGYISRDGDTRFSMRGAYGDCYEAMVADHEPDRIIDGADEYVFPVDVCVSTNRGKSCQASRLYYVPGGSRNGGMYKTSLGVFPVAFRNFAGLPRDWNAINVPALIRVHHRSGIWYGSARFNVDWTNPVLSGVTAMRNGESLNVSFNTNEPGTWGVTVEGENTTVEPRIGCDQLSLNSCGDDGTYCVLSNGFGHCSTQPWGGQVNTHGQQMVTIPFQPTSPAPYEVTIHYQDLGGNTASATVTAE